MIIKSGIDLVYLPKFRKALRNGGEIFIKRVFLEKELKEKNLEHLAGIFAAKEAIIKALSLPVDSWKDIHISYKESGIPIAQIHSHLTLLSSSLSISHDGDYTVAQFVCILR